MSRVRTGTIGWNFSNWENSYYPEDIPEDWKLAFYANDFSAVAVPEKLWAGESLQQVCEQLDDLDDGFAVYCLVETQIPSVEDADKVKAAVGEFFAGFIIGEHVEAGVGSQYPGDFIFPVARAGDDQSRYWAALPAETGQKLNVISLGDEVDLKTLRQQFASVQQQLDDSHDVFVMVSSGLPDAGPDIEFMQQLRTLLELMAIA